MKKALYALLIIILFSFSGCGSPDVVTVSPSPTEVSAEPIAVPSVIGMTLADAEASLLTHGFSCVSSNADKYPALSKDDLIVMEQTPPANEAVLPNYKIHLTCHKYCELYLDLESEYNLLFNKYDLEICLDGKEIGIIPNGEHFTKLIDVLDGDHELTVSKSGDSETKASKNLSVENSLTFKATVAHGSSIEFKNSSLNDDVQGARLEMISVENRVLTEAKAELEQQGFINVREEPYGEIWNSDNWIVISQNIAAGESADKNAEIILTCKKFDVYITELYVGKTLNSAEKLAADFGYTIKCINDADSSALDATIAGLSDSAKENWIVSSAKRSNNTLVLSLTYQKTPEEIAADKAQAALQKSLETYLPKANAEKALIVVFTNNCASDVFTEDGNYYDSAKLHGYNYQGEFKQTITDDGTWTVLDEKTWHIEDMHLLLPTYNTATRLSCDITFDGENYIVFHIRFMTASPEYIDTEDPYKTSGWTAMEPDDFYIHLTVPKDMVTGTGGQNATPTPRPTSEAEARSAALSKYMAWVDSQFSSWDGSHKGFNKLIKKNLNDEKSFKHIETSYFPIISDEYVKEYNSLLKEYGFDDSVKLYDILILTEFSAKNAFNATVKNTAIGIASYDDNTVRLVGIG